MFRKAKFQFRSKMMLVVIVVMAAFLAAFLGQILINNLSYAPSLSPDNSLIIRQSPDRLAQLVKAVGPILKDEIGGFVEVYFEAVEPVLVGKGVVLTNDGWIVAVAAAEGSEIEVENWNLVRLASGELISVLEIIKDPISPLIFMRIDSQQLSPVTLGSGIDTTPLQEYISAGYHGQLMVSGVVGEAIDEARYLNTGIANRFVKMTEGGIGDALYNEQAELVGIVVDQDDEGRALALQSWFIRDTLSQLLRDGELQRSTMGAYYIDLARQAVGKNLTGGVNAGALIRFKPEGLPEITESPAIEAGLRANDIVASVDGEVLNHKVTLSDLIINRDPEDVLELGVLRNGQPMTVEVVLVKL